MLSELERRIRKCCDAFLGAVTEERDLWEIALLEYYRYPLEAWRAEPEEGWEQPIPACFADLAPELPRLAAHKKEVCPSDGCPSVQLSLEWAYGWNPSRPRDRPKRKLTPAAVGLLLEYYLLVAARGDGYGARSCRTLFEEQSDRDVLERIAGYGARKPEEEMVLALRLRELCERWQLKASLDREAGDWLLDLTETLLESAFLYGCAEAGWHLYEFLSENDRFGYFWKPIDLLREAAEAGSADAQQEFGFQFLSKVTELPRECFPAGYCGDDISGEEAVHWLEKALPHKIEAALLLARLFLEGKGVPADEARAVRCLTAAVEGRYAYTGEGTPATRSICCRQLAECYAQGRGTVKDRRKAAELYQQARYSGFYLFRYCKDGTDVPRNPRAAVRYWMRDMCYYDGLTLWSAILGLVTSPGGCSVRLWPDSRRGVWNRQKRQSAYGAFCDLMREPTDLRAASDRRDSRYALLCGLLDREKVRLLRDGVRGGDSRCGDLLQELLARGTAIREMLEQLSLNSSGICDWPDSWYEEALERIEDQLAREEQVTEPSERARDLAPEDWIPAEDPAWGLFAPDPERA